MSVLNYIEQVLAQTWNVTAEMAPYLLFGFVIAGFVSVFLSPEWVERHLGGRGLAPVLKAVVLGIPLPLCSCSVIPVAASIRNHGASRGATTGFLLATPQTGVDSIVATWGMLGPV
ncbi:MAG TPA: permease, partial [Candidatus Hydrogenedentes bacterium]|nr:permease [Candidatus Hydrogenedentota bacterium]